VTIYIQMAVQIKYMYIVQLTTGTRCSKADYLNKLI